MRFVIMSLGSIGQRHLRNLRATYPDATIAVWRRPDSGTTVPALADHLCSSVSEVLAFRPDAAIIASPSSQHLAAALAMASAGVHMLVEKPLAMSEAGVGELIDICRERQLVLMVGYNLRFMPSLALMRDLVLHGAIGRVLTVRAEVGQFLPDWRPAADYRFGVTAQAALGGGVLLELSHDIDYVLWMFGLPNRVAAMGGKLSDLDWDVEDAVEILLEYDQPRRLVNVHLDMLQRSASRGCRIVGSDGVLAWDCLADRVDLFKSDSNQWRRVHAGPMTDRNQMYIDQLEAFVQSIRSGTSPECGGWAGLQVLRVVDAARRSIKERRSIELHKEQLP